MPCKKCKDGKYKWGNTGECKYDTKEACEKANLKKYNNMKPTPLGKKTYAEYAKELKEYNLNSQRVELGLADDVEKLTQQAKDLIPQLTNDNKFIESREKDIKKESKLLSKRESTFVKAEKKEAELFKLYEKAKDNASTAEREFNETKQALQSSKDAISELTKRVNKRKSQAGKLSKTLVKKLNALDKAAKDLGVKIPAAATGYKVVQKLNSLL
jgi:chromosome segregation ATPase